MVRGYQDVGTKPDAGKYDVLIAIRGQVVRLGRPRAEYSVKPSVALQNTDNRRGGAGQRACQAIDYEDEAEMAGTVGRVDRVREKARLSQEAVRMRNRLHVPTLKTHQIC
ncbi:hypothetical protein RJ035_007558, partial [Blastomyces gilchristii]